MGWKYEQREADQKKKTNPGNQKSTSYSNLKTGPYVNEEADIIDSNHNIIRMIGSNNIRIILNLKNFFEILYTIIHHLFSHTRVILIHLKLYPYKSVICFL